MNKAHFDVAAFYAALDAQRRAHKMTWRQVAEATGVSASTLTRMAQGRRPDVDGLAALAQWSGLDPAAFVRDGDEQRGQPEPMAMISTYLRSDPHLTDEDAQALEELIRAAYRHLRKD